LIQRLDAETAPEQQWRHREAALGAARRGELDFRFGW
jgi:hypothetical protein